MNYTYMVKCADGTLYTGWTNCVEKRLKAHNEESRSENIQGRKRPVELVYYEDMTKRRSNETGICNQAADKKRKTETDGVLDRDFCGPIKIPCLRLAG